MTDWRTLLREHDPAAETAGTIDAGRVERIRRAVIDAARHAGPVRSPWPWRVAFAAGALIVLAAGAGDDGRRHVDRGADVPSAGSGERRQLQFDTPGGTRIIWEINPDFTLRETIP